MTARTSKGTAKAVRGALPKRDGRRGRSPRLRALGPPSSFADLADRAGDELSWGELQRVTRYALLGDPAPLAWGELQAARWRCCCWLLLRGVLRDEDVRDVAHRGRWSTLERGHALLQPHPVEHEDAEAAYWAVIPPWVQQAVDAGELRAEPFVRVVGPARATGEHEHEIDAPEPEAALRHAGGLICVENQAGSLLRVRFNRGVDSAHLEPGARCLLRYYMDGIGQWHALAEDAEGDLLDPQGYALPSARGRA